MSAGTICRYFSETRKSNWKTIKLHIARILRNAGAYADVVPRWFFSRTLDLTLMAVRGLFMGAVVAAFGFVLLCSPVHADLTPARTHPASETVIDGCSSPVVSQISEPRAIPEHESAPVEVVSFTGRREGVVPRAATFLSGGCERIRSTEVMAC